MRRLDVGVGSYNQPAKLAMTVQALLATCRTDVRIFVIDNASPDPQTQEVIESLRRRDVRIVPVYLGQNTGYAGAVNTLVRLAETEYLAWCDHDAVVYTPGWDEQMAAMLDRFHELGILFPNGGPFQIPSPAGYTEVLWGVGSFWMTSRHAVQESVQPPFAADAPAFDERIGHQEEVDFQTRLRLKGFVIACLPGIHVEHAATASSDPASTDRISAGVRCWMNKWLVYWGGPRLDYHSPNVLRHEDWPPSALYLERFWRQYLPGLNADPEVIECGGVEYDLITVPRLKGFYRGRVI